MLVEIQNKMRNDQNSALKFNVVTHSKYPKPKSTENEEKKSQNRYEILDTDGNDEDTEVHLTAKIGHWTKHLTIHQRKFDG